MKLQGSILIRVTILFVYVLNRFAQGRFFSHSIMCENFKANLNFVAKDKKLKQSKTYAEQISSPGSCKLLIQLTVNEIRY